MRINIKKIVIGIIALVLLISIGLIFFEMNKQDNQEQSTNLVLEPITTDMTEEAEVEDKNPTEFILGEDLKGAVIQIALGYVDFDETVVNSKEWKAFFINRMIQNSRFSFEYLEKISDKNGGQIAIEELNYIQKSLTNKDIDFSDVIEGSVNRNEASSTLDYGTISEYKSENSEDGVKVTAKLEIGSDGEELKTERELVIKLVKNPDSCFDGYSIVSISAKDISSTVKESGIQDTAESNEHAFFGTDMQEEDNGVFPVEFLYAEDESNYSHFVYLDLSGLPELADMIRQNPGCDFRITFILNEDEADTIEKIVPTSITLEE